MLIAETCPPLALDEAGISTLIATFYARVREDESLGTVFARAIPEGHWAEHFGHMNAFWSSVMLSSGRYHGKPVQMHAKHLDVLTPAM
ncbi:MAG: group III truncated hemoglobin, partial [Acidovorax sp.]|nr:group III truncated hemoglobin [Acidovorax sp.]